MMVTLSDRPARERAATAGDCNIVVTAGAGTGKTTLLVNRLLHLLLHRPDPLTVREIVALTFTNKAADEMKSRLRDRLAALPDNELAAAALHGLEQSQIGTIHSFAAHLLRLYPIESGVDPSFTQDEGPRFDEFFEREWALWLDQELGDGGTHHDVWTRALQIVTLEDLRQLARSLAGELIPLDEGLLDVAGEARRPPIQQWLMDLSRATRALRAARSKANTLEHMLEDVAVYLEQVAQQGGVLPLPPALERDPPARTTQWSREDYQEAKRVIRVAQAVAKVRLDPLRPLLDLFIPFARDVRRRFVQTGSISFDGLVARARNLLRDHPVIRRELKTQFRSILVDEFQDTDPVQYEMILYLAEAQGQEAREWRQVRLEPGKLFIVGDPKQSIYAFRRADMEAYDAVVEDQVLAQTPPGERHTLCTNFRSHSGLLTSINACFARIFPARSIKGLQPQHDPLQASEAGAVRLPDECVQIRLVRPDDPEADAETVGRMEAEELARWLREEVLGRQEIHEQGMRMTIKPGHVAILFRTLTDMRDYVEALRRYAIPCLTEGEKHFYERQEVIDTINLLRAAVDPHDRLALTAVLRSSLGALPDAQVEALARCHLLDYRIARPLASQERQAQAAYDHAVPVYALLRTLSRALPCLPLTDVMDAMLAAAPLMELAAASIDGEQAVANLLKLRDVTVQLAQRSDLTLSGLVAELTKRVLDPPDETESSLAEDLNDHGHPGYVRLLSIHKAKGLEFPVVVLAGLQRGTNRSTSPVLVQHDWSTGIAGIRVGDLQTLGSVYLGDKLARRQEAEQSRVLYVAMTRAKRRLILSAGIPKQPAAESFLSMVAHGLGVEPDALGREAKTSTLPVEGGAIRLDVVSGRAVPLHMARRHGIEWRDAEDDGVRLKARWEERLRRRAAVTAHPLFMSPTLLKRGLVEEDETPWRRRGRITNAGSDTARWIGIVAHRVLEEWNFADDPEQLGERAQAVAARLLAAQDGLKDPQAVVDEVTAMLLTFAGSELYQTLRQADILGREVPFSIPWASTLQPGEPPRRGPSSVMEGVIDLVYRAGGRLWVADYKTDAVEPDEIEVKAEEYRIQAQVYTQAVSQTLGLSPAEIEFQVVFLRTGRTVSLLSGEERRGT
ncbi:UvrD-helicase domain-containing protein [Candidatus Nitrospira bockiana]